MTLFRDVETYERFGDHRTGAPGDHATTRWLSRRLSGLGLQTERIPFPHEVFHFSEAGVELADARMPAFPIWPVLQAGELCGRLALADAGASDAIAYVELPYAPNATLANATYRLPIEAALASRPKAIIGATAGPTGGIIALNSDPNWSTHAPIFLIGGAHAIAMQNAAHVGAEVKIRSIGEFEEHGRAYNVVARRPGAGPALVISTPVSGWFSCASERGAGIAVFLSVAQWAAHQLRNPLYFVATSGHEFEGIGVHHLLRSKLIAPPDRVALWVHIGANIAGREVRFDENGPHGLTAPLHMRGAYASASVAPFVQSTFSDLPGYAKPVVIDAASPSPGDVRFYIAQGYDRIVALVGAHPFHHTVHDRANITVSSEELSKIATAINQLIAMTIAPAQRHGSHLRRNVD